MFCLRSWLPLLFIPTNASPIFILLFFLCTYFLNRPCVYCSFLLLILFASSCHWSDHCFFDISNTQNFFKSPRPPSAEWLFGVHTHQNDTFGADDSPDGGVLSLISSSLNESSKILVLAALEEAKRLKPEWTGIGIGWLRSLLGRREWLLPYVDVYVRL